MENSRRALGQLRLGLSRTGISRPPSPEERAGEDHGQEPQHLNREHQRASAPVPRATIATDSIPPGVVAR